MEIFYRFQKICEKTALSIGDFDGVHKGHRKILSNVMMQKKYNLLPICITFKKNTKNFREIISLQEKTKIIEKIGIEKLFIIDFNSIKKLTANVFLKDILKNLLNVRQIICGENARFGNDLVKAKNFSVICKNNGIGLQIMALEKQFGKVISSTAIRKDLFDSQNKFSAVETTLRNNGKAVNKIETLPTSSIFFDNDFSSQSSHESAEN